MSIAFVKADRSEDGLWNDSAERILVQRGIEA